MTKEPDTSADDLRQRIVTVQGRFKGLAGGECEEGLDDIARGIARLLDTFEPGDENEQARLDVVLHGLDGLADYLGKGEVETNGTPAETKGLQQFITVFRKEARKRLSGLSISLMGIFNERAGAVSLDQSAGHLHAIRGGASMLGLADIAELAAAMEQVIVTMRRFEPEHRIWPTKPLMQGFSLLEGAIADTNVRLDADAARRVSDQLRQSSVQAPSKTPAALVSPQPPGVDEPREPSSEPELEQRVLVVDDMETIAASIGFVLADLDVPIDLAGDGDEALEKLRERDYSLVISDVDMPRLNGIALIKQIRADASLAHLPVILLTALDHPEERQSGIEAGASDYIIKGSIGGGELVARVRELLAAAPFVEKESTLAQKRILVAEDTETVAASIAFVLSEGPYDIVLAQDGKDALKRLQKESFDLLISDVQMPYMSGFELVQAVRSEPALAALPVIMLTSLDGDGDRDRGHVAGADRYLIKGEVAGGKLLTLVQELLRLE
ncbi:MAG: response regulator [Bradymonadaceae bacterium]